MEGDHSVTDISRIMDIVSPTTRSRMMSRIRGRNTAPELIVRKTAYGLGYRYRLNRPDLPGSPDLVFSRYNTAIFVHGCFWHRHEKCKYCYTPKSNIEFWMKKFDNNVARDNRVKGELERMGWRVAIIWECETKDFDGLRKKLRACLAP